MTRCLLTTALCLSLLGCGSDEHADSTCTVPAGDCYVDGMEKSDGQVRVRLVEANPGPPERGDFNRWLLEVTDLEGRPINDITVGVDPTMPAHGHGTTPLPTVTAVEGMPGQFEASPLNLFMPGLWQIRVRVTGPGEEPLIDAFVDFEFWIES